MRRWLCRAAFGLMLLAMPVWAQRHGGGGGAHFASRGGSAGHSGFAGHPTGTFHGGNPGRGAGVSLRIGDPFSNHLRNHREFRGEFRGSRGFYPYYPYASYYPYAWYDDPLYDRNDQDSYAEEYRPALDGDDSGVHRDLDRLNGKVDRLQEDVEARNRPKPDAEPATALVFRDQHVEEVRNYAISGGTLWVLNDQAAKKIPLAQLDLAATAKMNDDRGVDFQVPGPSLQLMIVR